MSATRARFACLAGALVASLPAAAPAFAQSIAALPDQTSRLRISNHDVHHIVCVGGDIDDVNYSAENGLAVERGGSDAWIQFLLLATEDPTIPRLGAQTTSYVPKHTDFRSEKGSVGKDVVSKIT